MLSVPHNLQTSLTPYFPDDARAALERAATSFKENHIFTRFWKKDASLWSHDDEHRWMGWLDEAAPTQEEIQHYKSFQRDVFARHFTDIVIMGMGGSSLGPYVLDHLAQKIPGFGRLHVVDSTDPYVIDDVRRTITPQSTLFIVASKSGGTLETRAYLDYFYHFAKQALGPRAPYHFVAITDPHTSLEAFGRAEKFWRIFHGNPQTGGRFSIFSPFGLIPSIAAGLSIDAFETELREAYQLCRKYEDNIATKLGIFLGISACHEKRNKLTVIAPAPLTPLLQWIEQIIAESTGKDGKGILPIIDNHCGAYDASERDRLFILFATSYETLDATQKKAAQLKACGHPSYINHLPSCQAIIAQCLYWECATALACHYLQINPFNQPDVQSTKSKTNALIAQYVNDDCAQAHSPKESSLPLVVASSPQTSNGVRGDLSILRHFLSPAQRVDYFAFLAYLPTHPRIDMLLKQNASRLWDIQRRPVLYCFGPRYLHSTGQLFKGGPSGGRFLLLTHQAQPKIAIAHTPLTFGKLEDIQGQGDLLALRQKGRDVLHIHINAPLEEGLKKLYDIIDNLTRNK